MRLQLALNVKNLDRAIAFYSEIFASPVHKQRPGYANFEIENPPLKLVLFEHPAADVAETGCCHAKQTKFWATGPDELDWEWYRVLDDAPHDQSADQQTSGAGCCGQKPGKEFQPDQVCCA